MKPKFARLGWLAMLLTLAFWTGTCFPPQPASTAEVRKSPPRQAFLSGSERSVPILMEISETLKQMDARLSRIEKIVATAAER